MGFSEFGNFSLPLAPHRRSWSLLIFFFPFCHPTWLCGDFSSPFRCPRSSASVQQVVCENCSVCRCILGIPVRRGSFRILLFRHFDSSRTCFLFTVLFPYPFLGWMSSIGCCCVFEKETQTHHQRVVTGTTYLKSDSRPSPALSEFSQKSSYHFHFAEEQLRFWNSSYLPKGRCYGQKAEPMFKPRDLDLGAVCFSTLGTLHCL